MTTATDIKWIYPHTAAERLGVDVRTVRRWVRRGLINSRNPGERKTKVCAGCVALLARHGQGAQAQCACWPASEAEQDDAATALDLDVASSADPSGLLRR